MKEKEKLLGQAVIDFVSAENTDQACLKHLENMQQVMRFSSDFPKRLQKELDNRWTRLEELQYFGIACAGTPGDACHPGLTSQQGTGVPGGWSCMRGNGLLGVSTDRREVWRSGCGHRV